MSATTAYQNRLKAIRLQTARAVQVEWDRLEEYHKDSAEPFARKVMPIVAAGQMMAARTTNAYVSRLARIQPVRLTPAMVTGRAARNVDPLEEYQRPFGEVWSALGDGVPLDVAAERGRSRLNVLAVADIWLASRAATAVIDQATAKITGWVRVADAGACDLCSAADGLPMTQAADLAGHPGCGCTSEPTFAETPDSAPADERAIAVHENDETGPVLYQAGQSFAAA